MGYGWENKVEVGICSIVVGVVFNVDGCFIVGWVIR